MHNALSVDHMIALHSFWERTPSGCRVDFRFNLHPPQYVSNEALAARDPRLLLVIDDWYRKRDDPSSSTLRIMSSDILRYTLALWRAPLVIENDDGVPFNVGALFDIENASTSAVKLVIEAYNLSSIDDVPYADSVYPARVVMRRYTLDLQYPGWESRLKVAHALESEPFAIANYVLMSAPVKSIDTPGMPDNIA